MYGTDYSKHKIFVFGLRFSSCLTRWAVKIICFFFLLNPFILSTQKKKKIIKKDEGKRNITHVGPIMGFRFYQDGLPNRRIPAHVSLRLSPCLNLRFFNISQQYTNQMMPRKIRPVDVDLPYDC